MSAAEIRADLRSPRFRLVDLLVRMCRRNEWPLLIFPLAVSLNRFAAPRCVFIFGMSNFLSRSIQPAAPDRGRRCVASSARLLFFCASDTGQDDVHLVAHHAGARLRRGNPVQVVHEPLKNAAPEIRMCHLTSTEEDGGFHLVAF